MSFPAECPRNLPGYTEHSSCQQVFRNLAAPTIYGKKKKSGREWEENKVTKNLNNVPLLVLGDTWTFRNCGHETSCTKLPGVGGSWETTQIPEDPLTQDLQDQGTGIASLGDSFAVSEFPMLRDLQGKTYINFIQQPKLM